MVSNAVLDRAEDIYQAMKGNRRNFAKKYKKEAENVMRGRAMNIAKSQVQTMNEERLKEIVKKRLSTKPQPASELEEGAMGKLLTGAALVAALLAGNKMVSDANPTMKKLKNAYEKAEAKNDEAAMEKIEDLIAKQEVYLSAGEGEDQSSNLDEKKGKTFPDLTGDGKVTKADILKGRGIELKEEELDYEGEMAKSELRNIIQNAEELFNMLDEDTQLEAWVQSKLTKANDYLSSVTQYLKYQSPPQQASMMDEEKMEVYYLDK
jgi:hypothetical protein